MEEAISRVYSPPPPAVPLAVFREAVRLQRRARHKPAAEGALFVSTADLDVVDRPARPLEEGLSHPPLSKRPRVDVSPAALNGHGAPQQQLLVSTLPSPPPRTGPPPASPPVAALPGPQLVGGSGGGGAMMLVLPAAAAAEAAGEATARIKQQQQQQQQQEKAEA